MEFEFESGIVKFHLHQAPKHRAPGTSGEAAKAPGTSGEAAPPHHLTKLLKPPRKFDIIQGR